MKNNNFEKYFEELSPELQKKARECRTMEELQAMLAENDVELSEDALSAVAGGCSESDPARDQGDQMPFNCPECGCALYYWDMCANEKGYSLIWRMYCNNPKCGSYNNGLWYHGKYNLTVYKY